MLRGLAQSAAWLLATGAAATLSWWGVHTALTGTAYDRPRALPIDAGAAAGGEAGARGGAESDAAETSGPGPSASPGSSSPAPPERSPEPSGSGPKPGDGAPSKPGKPPETAPSAPTAEGEVKSYPVAGGRVVFDLGERSASLVSATPDAGWEMQVWEQTEWIRVNFTSGARTTSVFCTWNGHPPTVQVVEG
ncbi:hypothetical protein DMH02_008920 [Streptomyces sp. WAC 00631]|uniref:hypothetical protein n=1 Tax=Streptomyces sp. WAC 00631 TaxID=2203201 RepID=UPI001E4F4D34|nr:hypothetical protein [Streptomyces sp. WAC 00631]MCC5033335.1 hypothetical protein [Streptomyces sp. WAC 00631]